MPEVNSSLPQTITPPGGTAEDVLATLGEITLVVRADGVVAGASVAGSSADAQTGAAALVGLTLGELLPDDAAALLGEAVFKACGQGHTRSLVLGPDAAFAGDIFETTVQSLTLAGNAHQALCRLRRMPAGGPTFARFGTRDFESALAHAHIAWFERDLVTNEAICSRSLAELYGFSRRDGRFTYDELLALIVPEDRPRHEQHCDDVTQTAQTDLEARVLRYRVQHPTKGIRHFEVRYRNIFDDGRPRAIGLAFDITDIRATEGRLRESVEWLDLAIASTNMVLWELDVKSRHVRTTENASAFLGLEGVRTQWGLEQFLERVAVTDLPAVEKALDALYEHGRPMHVQHRFEHPDGSHTWVETRAQIRRDVDGRDRCTGVTLDITQAVRAADELRQSEERLTRAMQQAQLAPFEWDVDANQLNGPPGVALLFGLPATPGPWHASDFLAALHPEDRDAIAETVQSPPIDAGRFTIEYRVVLPDGAIRHIESRQTLARCDDSAKIVFNGVFIDVTDRVALEQSRREMEQRLRMLARMVPGMVYQFRIDADGEWSIPYASEGAYSVLKVTPRYVEGHADAILGLLHPDDNERILSSVEHSARTLELWREEYRVVDADGSVRWLLGQASPLREPDGAVMWYGHMMDVTARKDAELALRENEEHLKLALASANLISWFWDVRDDTFTTPQDVDPVFRDEHGQLTMQRFVARLHDDDREHVTAAFEQKIRDRDGSLLDIEYRAVNAAAQQCWWQTKARAWFGDDGEVVGFYGITADITAQRSVQVEQEQLRNQLQRAQKMESIGLLTGGIAHDFNNIVSSILGYSSLALRRFGSASQPKLVDYLNEIQTAGKRARDMVQQLLTFSRTQPTNACVTDLAEVADDAMRLLRPMMPSSVSFRVDIEPGLAPVVADAGQLQQVIVNLCINARDAVDSTGTVVIRLANGRNRHVQCDSCHGAVDGDFVVLSVSDNGPGIPMADRARVFEPFFTTNSSGRGTGMGLAMVHGIVHAHHGHIMLDSRPGGGTRFEVLLPRTATADAAQWTTPKAETVPTATLPQRAPCVFVVDDEPSVAAFLGELLELHGYRARVFTVPEDALAAVRAAPDEVELVVTDQTMPGLTGINMARELLTLRPELPIVLVSGYSATVREADALAAGLRAFLPKPVDEEQLLEVVAGLCG